MKNKILSVIIILVCMFTLYGCSSAKNLTIVEKDNYTCCVIKDNGFLGLKYYGYINDEDITKINLGEMFNVSIYNPFKQSDYHVMYNTSNISIMSIGTSQEVLSLEKENNWWEEHDK